MLISNSKKYDHGNQPMPDLEKVKSVLHRIPKRIINILIRIIYTARKNLQPLRWQEAFKKCWQYSKKNSHHHYQHLSSGIVMQCNQYRTQKPWQSYPRKPTKNNSSKTVTLTLCSLPKQLYGTW